MRYNVPSLNPREFAEGCMVILEMGPIFFLLSWKSYLYSLNEKIFAGMVYEYLHGGKLSPLHNNKDCDQPNKRPILLKTRIQIKELTIKQITLSISW